MRLNLIDFIRGMLVFLMSSTHALHLAGVREDSFLNSRLWLPHGWATTGFIAFSGITAALVFDWENKPAEAARGARRRGYHLLIVMFISNILLLATKYVTTHEVERLLHLDWWLGLVSLHTPYSISGVLLPTSILLLIVPALNAARRQLGLQWLVFGIITVALLAELPDQLRWNSQALPVRVVHFGAGFPVLLFVSTGALGWTMGCAWKRLRQRRFRPPYIAWIPVLMIAVAVTRAAVPRTMLQVFVPLGRILVLILVALVLTRLPGVNKVVLFLRLIGRYALFCFIGHRIILQAVAMAGRGFQTVPHELLYALYLAVTCGLLSTICVLRRDHIALDHALQKAYM